MNYKNSKMCIFVESILKQLDEGKKTKKVVKSSFPSKEEVEKLIKDKLNYMNAALKGYDERQPDSEAYKSSKYLRPENVDVIMKVLENTIQTKQRECRNIKKLILGEDSKENYDSKSEVNFDSPKAEYSHDMTHGNLTTIHRLVLIDLYKKYANIIIPTQLNAEGFPSYAFHLLSNFIRLQCAGEMLKGKKVTPEVKQKLIKDIFTNRRGDNIASQINEYINTNINREFDELKKEYPDIDALSNDSIEILKSETTAEGKVGSKLALQSKQKPMPRYIKRATNPNLRAVTKSVFDTQDADVYKETPEERLAREEKERQQKSALFVPRHVRLKTSI